MVGCTEEKEEIILILISSFFFYQEEWRGSVRQTKWRRFARKGVATSFSQVALMTAIFENAIQWQQAKQSVRSLSLLAALCFLLSFPPFRQLTQVLSLNAGKRQSAGSAGAAISPTAFCYAMAAIMGSTPFASIRD
jgi:hypothetical protein